MSSEPPPNINGGPGKTSLAFGFSKTKAPARKLAVNMEETKERRQQITGFEGGVMKTASGNADEEEQEAKRQYVIPKLENTYKTGVGKKFVPSFVPPASDAPIGGNAEDRFEMAQQDTRPSVTGYGLDVRAKPEVKSEQVEEENGHNTLKGQPPKSFAQLEQQAFKEDMEVLPDAPEVEAYEAMPIEEFGKAMLLGMGWKEGQGVGRNRKVAAPIEYLRRPERLGLGAAAANIEASKKQVHKMGDKPSVRPEELVLAPDADGRVRHVRHLDEKLVKRSELQAGARPGRNMRVTGGRHAGVNCVVVSLLPEESGRSARAVVRLLPSQAEVEVRVKDLDEQQGSAQAGEEQQRGNGREQEAGRSERGGRDAHKSRDRDDRVKQRSEDREARDGSGRRDGEGRAVKEEEGGRGRGDTGHRSSKQPRSDDRDRYSHDGGSKRGRYGDDSKQADKRRSQHGSSDDEEEAPRAPSWLAPYIKVRVIDKRMRDGRMYLKKGAVVDVHPGGLCDVVLDDSRESVQLKQKQLETVVPKEVGAAVLIVSGRLRGQKARLHAKSAEGACAVQLASDFTVHRLMLDDIAMYLGSLDE